MNLSTSSQLIIFSFGLFPDRSQTTHLPGFGVGVGLGGFGVGLGFGGLGVGLGFGGFGVGLGLAGADVLPELPWALTLAAPMLKPIPTRTVAQTFKIGANRF